ncbi:MAG: hypothetical protein K2Q12_10180 [Rickettsiales bacterium]|nr:hypothetical protein [Rickettsiales bacterium]
MEQSNRVTSAVDPIAFLQDLQGAEIATFTTEEINSMLNLKKFSVVKDLVQKAIDQKYPHAANLAMDGRTETEGSHSVPHVNSMTAVGEEMETLVELDRATTNACHASGVTDREVIKKLSYRLSQHVNEQVRLATQTTIDATGHVVDRMLKTIESGRIHG